MTRTAFLYGMMHALLLLAHVGAVHAESLVESPYLESQVQSGELPPMAERLPDNPLVVDLEALGRSPGRYCCTLRTLMESPKDLRMITVYSYARLVGYNEDLELVPDILESFTVRDNKEFTFRLRKGHRWSDGHPFTSEDFRYFWEDVALNEEAGNGSPPAIMVSDGNLPKFEIIDEWTVRFTWETPNPIFLPAIAGARPLYIYAPAHYLKQFHSRYAAPDDLAAKIAAERVDSWAALHTRKARQYRAENPDLPTLGPWSNTTPGPSERYVFARNPYFHRVDPTGQQLPYIDEIAVSIASGDLIPAKTGAGDTDLQSRYLRFDDYTFLKAREADSGYRVLLWRDGTGSRLTLYPNMNITDPIWRRAFRDVRVRRALSLAIDRFEINQQLYYGLATESANSILPASPLYDPRYAEAWVRHDPVLANALLDEAGFTARGKDGIRLLADGRPMEIIVETFGEDTSAVDALELITDYWKQIGVGLFIRSSSRDIVRRRLVSGQTMVTLAPGLNTGMAIAAMAPEELAPVSAVQPQWPVWGQHTESIGVSGSAADTEPAKTLLQLYGAWRTSESDAERHEIWRQMLEITADQVLSIGIANQTRQPVVISKRLRNVPEDAIHAFSPLAYFGVYRPDTFWFEE